MSFDLGRLSLCSEWRKISSGISQWDSYFYEMFQYWCTHNTIPKLINIGLDRLSRGQRARMTPTFIINLTTVGGDGSRVPTKPAPAEFGRKI